MNVITEELLIEPITAAFPQGPVMLDIRNLGKNYPTAKGEYVVLENLNVQVFQGEFVSIIGHSGCGKSTLLTMIAGLNKISKGEINLDGKPITKPGPDRGIVFQSPSLFPWMTSIENVLIGVEQVFPHGTKKERLEICQYYPRQSGAW